MHPRSIKGNKKKRAVKKKTAKKGGRSSSVSEGRVKPRTVRTSTNSIIVSFDIIGFGELAPTSQANAVRELWKKARSLSLAKPGPGGGYDAVLFQNCDGLYAAFLVHTPKDHKLKCKEVVRYAIRVIKHLKEKASVDIRAVINEGYVYAITENGRDILFGSAINECQHLVALGGPGQLICSESFCQRLSGHEAAPNDSFDPPIPKKPFCLDSVTEQEYEARALMQLPGVNVNPHGTMSYRATVAQMSRHQLSDVVQVLAKNLYDLLWEGAVSESSVRVGILAPKYQNGRRCLVPIGIRFDAAGSLLEHRTYYELYPVNGRKEPWRGCVAKAFVEKEGFAMIHNLPDYQNDDEFADEYIAELSSYGLVAEDIADWSKKPRFFASVAVGPAFSKSARNLDPRFGPGGGRIGVLCIDGMEPPASDRAQSRALILEAIEEINSMLTLSWYASLIA